MTEEEPTIQQVATNETVKEQTVNSIPLKEEEEEEQALSLQLLQQDQQNGQESLKRKRTSIQPRWYNQAYLLFLALRQHPTHSLPRTELIDAAIELDKKFSIDLQLPRVFRGKTPKNSASASLTTNSDRYFVAFKPEGSKSTHFKLAYEPNHEASAVAEYQKWCTKLVEHDWPFCFGVPREQSEQQTKLEGEQKSIEEQAEDATSTSHYHTPVSHPEEEEEEEELIGLENHEQQKLDTIIEEEKRVDDMDSTTDQEERSEKVNRDTFMDAMNYFPEEEVEETNQPVDHIIDKLNTNQLNSPPPCSSSTTSPTPLHSLSQQSTSSSPAPSTPTTITTPHTTKGSKKREPIPPEPFIALDQLDLSNIPQSWHDIVYVAPSLIPGGGNGLFAKRKLPYNTPIGFYFGVPMTEDEFDSTKDRVGRASEYSIMYRRTVLDATDPSGQPILDEFNPRFCPFHFMNETNSQKTASIAFVEGAIVNQIICWTKKDIPKDEELLVWYGKDVHRYWTEEEEAANKLQEQQEKQRKKKNNSKSSERALHLEQKKQQKEFEKVQKLQQAELEKLAKIEEKKLKKKAAEEAEAEAAIQLREEQKLEQEAIEAEKRANQVGKMFGEQIMTMDQLMVTEEELQNATSIKIESQLTTSQFMFKQYHPRTNKKRRVSYSNNKNNNNSSQDKKIVRHASPLTPPIKLSKNE